MALAINKAVSVLKPQVCFAVIHEICWNSFSICGKSLQNKCIILKLQFQSLFLGQQLWILSNTTLENKAGIWKSSSNWSLPIENTPGNIENLFKNKGG